jgi:hypothetical protein
VTSQVEVFAEVFVALKKLKKMIEDPGCGTDDLLAEVEEMLEQMRPYVPLELEETAA